MRQTLCPFTLNTPDEVGDYLHSTDQETGLRARVTGSRFRDEHAGPTLGPGLEMPSSTLLVYAVSLVGEKRGRGTPHQTGMEKEEACQRS